jgi:hypothetical protein
VGHPGVTDAELLTSVERSATAHFGAEPARASITFLGVEPIEVLRFDGADERSYISLGMCRRPMTDPDAAVLAVDGPRAELTISTKAGSTGGERDLWRRLAVLAAAPTVEGVVYREGMTLDLSEPLVPGSRCTGVLVGASAMPPIVVADVEVRVLRLDPVTQVELAWSRVHGTPALRERWASQRVDLLDLGRDGVRLD